MSTSGHDVVILGGGRHVVWQCRTCGVFATCPEVVWEQQIKEGGYHHCPNGHQWGWSNETCERERLRQERDRLKQQMARLEDEKREADERTRQAELATARLKKRAAAGTCPCCRRTFANMSQHMKRQHPGYVKSAGANVVAVPVKALKEVAA